MATGTRTRITDSVIYQGPQQCNGASCSGRPAAITYNMSQITTSEDHQWYRYKNNDIIGKVDLGGPFTSERFLWEPQYRNRVTYRSSATGLNQTFRDGCLLAVLPNTVIQNGLKARNAFYADSVMDSWGTTAISKVIPTKSPVDLGSSAAELISGGLPAIMGKGLLKSIIKDHRKVGSHAKAGADEFLNYSFGIAPLIGDLKGTAKSIVGAAERLKQLERDSGRLVRRKFQFPLREEVIEGFTTGTSVFPNGWSAPNLYSGNLSGHHRHTQDIYRVKRWFSGAFTYHLNIGERHRNQLYAAADNARLLLGVKLDAEVLWNLAPWSWLADWFGNVGDISTNISHFSRDGLVMPYGYMMCESTNIMWQRQSKLNWFDPIAPKTITDSLAYVRKQRRPAHPYGFGFTDMLLDTRQTSILAALGISKAPRR